MHESSFKIFNASAGSGKTFTLVKEILKAALSSSKKQGFYQILAVTFTNKAVNEMKQRILEGLIDLSTTRDPENSSAMAKLLTQELGINQVELQKRSSETLKNLLHNYAYFDVSTIDKFTHRVIRSFARDLNLSQNFEVLLDTDLLLEEAVINLLSKAGTDKELTDILVQFALDKTDEDKHWQLNRDLITVGQMLFSENAYEHISRLEEKNVADFTKLKEQFVAEISFAKSRCTAIAVHALEEITEAGLTETDFLRQTLPNHFKKIMAGELSSGLYNNSLEQQLREGNVLKKNVPPPIPLLIESLLESYLNIKHLFYRIAFLKNVLSNLVPLTILKAIGQEVKFLEKERNLLPISSFNTLIANEIAEQPAPFIYERLGEKYRNYYIDEFQDTSSKQWNNLVPLVSNALVSLDMDGNPGSLLIVGDVKQAIYRWRGGQPEQFLGLVTGSYNPFDIEPEIQTLDTNYRSRENVIAFNNAFFESTSAYIAKPTYQSLFAEETRQQFNTRKGGLVQIEFLSGVKEDLEAEYIEQVNRIIKESREVGYNYGDICILTRKKDQGISISEGLIAQQIPVVSSETLLLKNSAEVLFLINLLYLAHGPEDQENTFRVLDHLIPEGPSYHRTISQAIQNPIAWLKENSGFDMQWFRFQSVYDGLSYAINAFDLAQESNAYISYLMDEVWELDSKTKTRADSFIDYWEKHSDKLSISSSDRLDAIKVMTIHKAKGLEFPIVIYPYANTKLYDERDAKIWLPVEASSYQGFEELLLQKKKEIQDYGEVCKELYESENQKLELDAFNLLYVALTRAIDALYVLTEKELDKTGQHNPKKFSGLFIHHLKEIGLWDENSSTYRFGQLPKKSHEAPIPFAEEVIPFLRSTKKEIASDIFVRKNRLWDDSRTEARKRGTLIHYIMSFVASETDVIPVIRRLIERGIIPADEREEMLDLISQIVGHPDLKAYFGKETLSRNEQEIITENGLILRPDRLVFLQDEVVVIDYKTGKPKAEHQTQLSSYESTLESMGYQRIRKIIVYLDKEVTPIIIN